MFGGKERDAKLEKDCPLQWFKHKNMEQAGFLKVNAKLTERVDSPKEHKTSGSQLLG